MSKRQQDLRERLGGTLSRAARTWRRAVDRRLQPLGLTEATWLPLLHLARARAPMRQKELAASLVLDGSSVVRLIDALEAAGHVRRAAAPGDRRARAITLTAQGIAVVARVETEAAAVRDRALAGLGGAEVAAAARVIQRVCANLEAMLEAGE